MSQDKPPNKPIGPKHLKITEVPFLKPQSRADSARPVDKRDLVAAMKDTAKMIKGLRGE